MKIGIVGGTGFYNLVDGMQENNVSTEYGEVVVYEGKHEGKDIYFLPRHGKSHDSLAHQINYRANMMALKELGVNHVVGMCAVGSLNPDIPVGALALLDQFMDVTTNRVNTYGKYSVEITQPYCPDLNQSFLEAADALEYEITPKANYICVDGPRYETSLEINVYKQWGMDVVGMTNATEAILARELGIAYAVVTISTDLAAGTTDVPPDLEAHKNVVKDNQQKIKNLFLKTIELISDDKPSIAHEAYERALAARKEKLAQAETTEANV
ncbi:MTAP family purine nucleoside phosphorylase [Halobacillus naozhouensis]|uniref:Purine nucleoside phosphorylase n=1 Tax=Halobacillus naozhouensis TaxID=554880 RepID=A0ABY8J0I3_9BACI|nr:MTAP family purine nucleoside phosphorylase [Halobacillus naozhouensis]WFT74270.1 MTAP family purine nucleoside phosphorylase [Halobacillus naozhouensis]